MQAKNRPQAPERSDLRVRRFDVVHMSTREIRDNFFEIYSRGAPCGAPAPPKGERKMRIEGSGLLQ